MIKNSIAIIGGTFDPIHNAHLQLAHMLHQQQFQTIRFIPCKQPWYKNSTQTTTEQRVTMINLAIQPYPHYHCDLREIQRKTPSYTIETLKSLRHDYPDASLSFTMGMDAFNTLDQWHYFDHFLDYAHLIIFPRGGYTLNPSPLVQLLLDNHQINDISPLHQQKCGAIYVYSEGLEDPLSSTQIRTLLKKNDNNAQHYLPKAVFEYITQQHIYPLLPSVY